MIDSPLYCPPSFDLWQGRKDSHDSYQYLYQIVKMLDLTQKIESTPKSVALLGFACDEGVVRNQGRPGAKYGPSAIKRILARLANHSSRNIYDAGEIKVDGDLLAAQKLLAKATEILLNLGMFPIILGGGHETAWGHYLGIEKYLKKSPLDIINFDAHFDLREIASDKLGSSGTPFRQIAQQRMQNKLQFDYHCVGIQKFSNTQVLFDSAKNLGVNYILASEIHLHGSSVVEQFINEVIKKNTPIYLSICLDALSSCYCPGVSAPQVFGLTPMQILPVLLKLAACPNLVSVDIVELNPNFDVDNRTAQLAVQILALFL
ncbi:MAG: formimidoylglutamase [Myxococcales bacterium]|nr:formimidoylglutamase [Myxococcales bacterium]USN49894.1 MAG: formimidoylglutamase [Myxococcales bacterium]